MNLKIATTRTVYIACLSSYNAGKLVGASIDMSDVVDAEDLEAQIKAAIKGEEWAVHDQSGWFGTLPGEIISAESLVELHETLTEYEDRFDAETIEAAAAISNGSTDLFETLEKFCGAYERAGDYAYECAESDGTLASVPEHLQQYIDFESMERDWKTGGTICVSTVKGTRYIFSC
jgi:antirestriction protein